eukprot:TRINITY_DN22179_c0_g1_i1.p2 TRINITY_DN22179_c0_g1~~TRINITY_DN22179_c0_g1_i1.p2  ORF type:complete len:167 (+),score=65.35 TRINITY_DN22179_c0_g1_i1:49-501(+)
MGDPEGVLADLKESFQRWSEKQSEVSPAELQAFLRSVGQQVSLADMVAIVEEVDHNGTGVADFNDVLSLLHNARREKADDPQAALRAAFKAFDRADLGYISPAELVRVMGEFGEQVDLREASELLRFADRNGDGEINYEEFCRFIAGAKQ